MIKKFKAWQAGHRIKKEVKQLTDTRENAIEELKKINSKNLSLSIDNI